MMLRTLLVLFCVSYVVDGGTDKKSLRCIAKRGVCMSKLDGCPAESSWHSLCGRSSEDICCLKGSTQRDYECIRRGGQCKNTSTTLSNSEVRFFDYCGDARDSACYIKNFQPGDEKCMLNGGECIDVRQEVCWNGLAWPGRCGGSSHRHCCILRSRKGDKRCVTNYGGHCWDVDQGCGVGNFTPSAKVCKDYPRRQCCVSNHRLSDCVDRGGRCMFRSEVSSLCGTGEWSNHYCDSQRILSCCFSKRLGNDTACIRNGGRCIDTRTEKCVNGRTWANRCGGESYRECCIPRSRRNDRICIERNDGHCESESSGHLRNNILYYVTGCKDYPNRRCRTDTSPLWIWDEHEDKKCKQEMFSCSNKCMKFGDYCEMEIKDIRDTFEQCGSVLNELECATEKSKKCMPRLGTIDEVQNTFMRMYDLCMKTVCVPSFYELCFGGKMPKLTANGRLSTKTKDALCRKDRFLKYQDCVDSVAAMKRIYNCIPTIQGNTEHKTWLIVEKILERYCKPVPRSDAGCAFCAEMTTGRLSLLPGDTDNVRWTKAPSVPVNESSEQTRCNIQGVLHIRIPKWAGSVTFTMNFEEPTGYSFHIADSPMYKGYGFPIYHSEVLATDSTLLVYGNERSQTALLGNYTNIIASSLMVRMSQNRIYIRNPGFLRNPLHKDMFSNTGFYLGLNHAMHTLNGNLTFGGVGTGLCSVCIFFYDQSVDSLHTKY